jgi:hypothetical protein
MATTATSQHGGVQRSGPPRRTSRGQPKQDHLATLSTNSLHRCAQATHDSLISDEADSAVATQAILVVVTSARTGRPLAQHP